MLTTLIHFSLLSFVVVFASKDAPKIKIDQGILRGKFRQTWKGRTFSAFTGIPYAKPPVGELRFKAAVAADSWNGVFDASKSHAVCPQINIAFNDLRIRGSEDCLYLNVYTPQLADFNKELLPVMFYIHGGGFMTGDANPHLYGPDILLDKNVVLVTTNYRLGALGFLSTQDSVAPGNNGLKDQNFALKWTKKNIANFGGDPDRITIFGQSAGGASTHYHVISPLSNNLFKAGIAHSGSALASWALAPPGQSLGNSKRLAKFLNCSTSSALEMIECLKNVEAYDFIKQDTKLTEWCYDPVIPFKPVIEPKAEGAFLTEHPIDLIKSGKSDVAFMTGITTADGTMKSAGLYNFSNLIEDLDKDFNRVAPLLMQYHETAPNKDLVSKKIREFYFPDDKIGYSTKAQLTDMITDNWFFIPQNMAAQLHAQYSKGPVYYFVFGYRGTVSLGPLLGDPSHDYGVCHGDELNYLFSSELFDNYVPNEPEQKMNDIMTTLWTNFAVTGNPTPNTNSLISTKWESIQGNRLSYYFIENEKEIKMVDDLYKERTEFWKTLPIGSTRSKFNDEL